MHILNSDLRNRRSTSHEKRLWAKWKLQLASRNKRSALLQKCAHINTIRIRVGMLQWAQRPPYKYPIHDPAPVAPSSLFPPPTPDSIPQTSQKQTQAQTLKKPFLKTPLHLKMGMLFAPFVPSVFHPAGSMAGYHSCPFPSLPGQSAQRCCTNDNTGPRRRKRRV